MEVPNFFCPRDLKIMFSILKVLANDYSRSHGQLSVEVQNID